MEVHLGSDFVQSAGQEVRASHPRLERAEDVLDGLPTDLHHLGPGVEPLLHAIQHGFMLPSADATLRARGALGFEHACPAHARPVAADLHCSLSGSAAVKQVIYSRTTIAVAIRVVRSEEHTS